MQLKTWLIILIFLETSYLLIFGELPNSEQLQKFEEDIKAESLVDEEMKKILDGFPSAAHPMGVISALTSALTSFNPNSVNVNSEKEIFVVQILAKFLSWFLGP